MLIKCAFTMTFMVGLILALVSCKEVIPREPATLKSGNGGVYGGIKDGTDYFEVRTQFYCQGRPSYFSHIRKFAGGLLLIQRDCEVLNQVIESDQISFSNDQSIMIFEGNSFHQIESSYIKENPGEVIVDGLRCQTELIDDEKFTVTIRRDFLGRYSSVTKVWEIPNGHTGPVTDLDLELTDSFVEAATLETDVNGRVYSSQKVRLELPPNGASTEITGSVLVNTELKEEVPIYCEDFF